MNQTQIETCSWRFEIRHLFYLVALHGSAIGLWGWFGVIPASLYDGIEPDFDFELPNIKIIKWQGYISLGMFLFLLAIPIVLVGRKRN